MKLESEHFRRRLVLGLLVGMLLLLSGVAELHHRRVSLADLDSSMAGGLVLVIVGNVLPALVALFVIPRLAARFIRALYDTKDLQEARGFLHRNMFGMQSLRPLLIVKQGRIDVGGGDLSDRVGGRALLIVYNDSAVVLERGGRLTRVVGPSIGFLQPFERIWEVVDLRHQRWPLTVNAMTKEGIPISCQADITFKIDDRFIGRGGGVRTKQPVETKAQRVTDAEIAAELEKAGIGTPLPYTDDAVFNAATGVWVRIRQKEHDEQLRKWTGRVVIGEVEGTLRSILARYRLDWLIKPPRSGQPHPRERIREQLEQRLREALPPGNRLGARILRVDLGEIDVKDERISAQWVEAWQAEWERRALESKAEGEAELARLDTARVPAQAEMVLTLTEAVRPFVTSEEELSSYVLAMRFIETLRWMAYDPLRRVFLPPETLRMLKELDKTLSDMEEEPIPEAERLVRERRWTSL
jgi:hypothetical protein